MRVKFTETTTYPRTLLKSLHKTYDENLTGAETKGRQSVIISYTHTLPNMWLVKMAKLVQNVGPGVHYGLCPCSVVTDYSMDLSLMKVPSYTRD